MVKGLDFWFSKRKLILSPYIVGMVEIRISNSESPEAKEIRPSCGRRFSEIFNFAIIFRREIIASWNRIKLSGTRMEINSPSIR